MDTRDLERAKERAMKKTDNDLPGDASRYGFSLRRFLGSVALTVVGTAALIVVFEGGVGCM